MRAEDKVLKLLKEKALLMSELQEKLQLSTVEVLSALAFMRKYKLVEVMPTATGEHEERVNITARGLQLLDLPSLPEDETTASSEFSEDTIRRRKAREDER